MSVAKRNNDGSGVSRLWRVHCPESDAKPMADIDAIDAAQLCLPLPANLWISGNDFLSGGQMETVESRSSKSSAGEKLSWKRISAYYAI